MIYQIGVGHDLGERNQVRNLPSFEEMIIEIVKSYLLGRKGIIWTLDDFKMLRNCDDAGAKY